MIKPRALFFDFVETVADVSRVPEAERRAYASLASAIASDKASWRPMVLTGDWDQAVIPPTTAALLQQLREYSPLVVLTNSVLPFVAHISRRHLVSWDAILCGEMFRQCKPHPSVYRGALELMRLDPSEAMMVAAHEFDVTAARGIGMQGWLIGDKSSGTDGSLDQLVEFMRESK